MFSFCIRSLTLAFIVLYTAVSIVVSLNRFWQYQSFYFDFGIFDRAIWQVSRLELPLVDHINISEKDIIIFADHFNPSIFLLSPLFWATDRSEILLIAQSAAVGFSAVVGYLIAKHKIKNKVAILALIVAYLGYVGLQNALISDFHEATVAVLPLMIIFWSVFNKKWKWYFVSLFILLGFKETFAGLGIGIGFFILLYDKKNFKVALATILVSFIWALLVIKLLIPIFSGGIYLYQPKTLPSNTNEFLDKVFIPDLKWKTVLYSYLTFGFLPLLDLSILPAIFQDFFIRFIFTDGKGQDLGMHYNALLSVLLFIGALNAIVKLEKSRFKFIVPYWALVVIFTVITLHRFILHGPLGLFYNPVFYEQNARVEYVNKFVKNFPNGGLIMTQNDLAVRLTHQKVKLLRENYREINPDHIIFNLTPGQNPNSFFPLTYERAVSLKNVLLSDKGYRVRKFGDELYIFSK